MVGMLAPEYEEVVTGDAEVREIFPVPKIGAIAGCYVQNGVDHPRLQGPLPPRGHDHLEGRDQLAAALQGRRPRGRRPASSAASASPTSRTSSPATSSRPTRSARSPGSDPALRLEIVDTSAPRRALVLAPGLGVRRGCRRARVPSGMASAPPSIRPPRLPASLEPRADPELDHDAEWVGLDVAGDLGGVEAEDVEIAETRLSAVALTGARLDRLRLVDVVLEGCELSGALLDEASLTRVELRTCRLSGLVLTRAKLRDVRFVDCKLDDASLRMAVGERVAFEGCSMRGADLYEAKLPDVVLSGCDLTDLECSKADLAGARLHGSTWESHQGRGRAEGRAHRLEPGGPAGAAAVRGARASPSTTAMSTDRRGRRGVRRCGIDERPGWRRWSRTASGPTSRSTMRPPGRRGSWSGARRTP